MKSDTLHRTNLVLDDKLVKEGLRLSGLKTKKELVDNALREFVRRRGQLDILKLRGKIHWEGNLDEMRKTRYV